MEPYILFKNVKKARLLAEMSQKQLAKKLGVSDKTISAYETGRAIPPAPTLTKIAKITDISILEIMGLENKKNSNNIGALRQINQRLKKLEERVSSIEQVIMNKLVPSKK